MNVNKQIGKQISADKRTRVAPKSVLAVGVKFRLSDWMWEITEGYFNLLRSLPPTGDTTFSLVGEFQFCPRNDKTFMKNESIWLIFDLSPFGTFFPRQSAAQSIR